MRTHLTTSPRIRLAVLAAAVAVVLAIVTTPVAADARVLAHGGTGISVPPAVLSAPVDPSAPMSDSQRAVATLALAQLGKGLNGPNTVDGRDFLGSHAYPAAWCAVFAVWVWGQNAMDIGGLDAWAGSFVSYGRAHGTYRSSGPRVGDAVVMSRTASSALTAATGTSFQVGNIAHVGIVVGVTDSTVTVVNGDWGNGRGGAQLVRLASYPLSRSDAGEFASGTGQYVAGYVAPVPAQH